MESISTENTDVAMIAAATTLTQKRIYSTVQEMTEAYADIYAAINAATRKAREAD